MGRALLVLCPRCGRRCAVLYPLACRICAKGRYASEMMTVENRLIAKAYSIRDRLGRTSGGLFCPFPTKPKGMHWTIYKRLVAKGEKSEKEILQSASARFGVPVDRFW